MAKEIWLFSYGTLRQANVQRALFGREVTSVEDTLIGFDLGTVAITDASVIEKSGSDRHPILTRSVTEGKVQGAVLRLSEVELEAVDRYEVADYVRVSVVLASGREAFVFVQRDEAGE